MGRIFDRAMAGVEEVGIVMEGCKVEGTVSSKTNKRR